MADTPLHAQVHFIDLETGTDLGTTDAVNAFVEYRLGAPDTVSYTIIGQTAKTVFDRSGTSGNVMAEVLFGGVCFGRKMTVKPQYDIAQPGTLVDNGPSIASLYDGAIIDRLTAYNITVRDVIAAIFLTVPGIPGIFTPKEFVFTPIVASAAMLLEISEDLQAVSVLKAIDTLSRDMGAQLGVDHGQFWCDSGARTITIGVVGTSYAGYFGDKGGLDILRRTQLQQDWEGTGSAVKIQGGSSDHGLPPSAKITGIVGVDSAGGEVDCTFMAGVYAGSTLGGVYFLSPDLIWNQMTQDMGVTSICQDVRRGITYGGTDRGVYEAWIHDRPGIWKQTGGYTGKVKRVFVDTTSMGTDRLGNPTPGAQVYIVSDDPVQGLAGLISYPAIDADVQLGIGLDYWYMIYGGDVLAASVISDIVYYTLSSDPTVIHRMANLRATSGTRVTTTASTPNLYAITDLIRLDVGTYVLTTGGSLGFYFINGTNEPSTMADDSKGLPGLTINNVIQGIDGELYACTDQGLFHRTSAGWVSVTDIGVGTTRKTARPLHISKNNSDGLLGLSIDQAAIGWPVPPPTQTGSILVPSSAPSQDWQVIASSGSDTYLSSSNGEFWTNITQERVKPDTWIREMGAAKAGDADFAWVVSYDGQNRPVWTLVKKKRPFSPGAAAVVAEVVEITADVNTSPGRASQALVATALRYAHHIATPIGTGQQVETWFDDWGSVLTLRPGMLIHMYYTDPACGDWPETFHDEAYKIIGAKFAVDENGGHAIFDFGTSLATKRYTADELGADMLYTLSRLART